MLGKLFFWGIIAFIVMLICSKITLDTSIYKAEENRLEIIFPQWHTDKPWLYFYWTPGTVKWHPDVVEEDQEGVDPDAEDAL